MSYGHTGATLAALLAAVFAAAHCAPSGGAAGTTAAAGAAGAGSPVATQPPQWHNPCSVLGKSVEASHPRRHSGKGGAANQLRELLVPVKMQFSRAQGWLKQHKPRITRLYKEVADSFPSVTVEWLNSEHFEWFKEHARSLRQKEKVAAVLARMHVSLQTMLATVISLQQFTASGTKFADRKPLLMEVRNEVNAMLCESEETLLQLNATVPDRVEAEVVAWDNSASGDTHLLAKDSLVLSSLTRSVKSWLQVLKTIMRPPKAKGEGKGKGKKPKRTTTTRKPRRRLRAQH